MERMDLSLVQRAGGLLTTPEIKKRHDRFIEGIMIGVMSTILIASLFSLLL